MLLVGLEEFVSRIVGVFSFSHFIVGKEAAHMAGLLENASFGNSYQSVGGVVG